MVRKFINVILKIDKPTDRDSFKYKRVELPGSLIYDLFKEYYTLQQRNIFQKKRQYIILPIYCILLY